MLYHSASRRTRRSNNRYLHISTPLSIVQSQDLGIKKVETEDIGIENVRIRIFVWHKSFVSKILSKKGGGVQALEGGNRCTADYKSARKRQSD